MVPQSALGSTGVASSRFLLADVELPAVVSSSNLRRPVVHLLFAAIAVAHSAEVVSLAVLHLSAVTLSAAHFFLASAASALALSALT